MASLETKGWRKISTLSDTWELSRAVQPVAKRLAAWATWPTPQSIYSNEQTLPRPLPLLVAWGVGEFLFVYCGKPFMHLYVRSMTDGEEVDKFLHLHAAPSKSLWKAPSQFLILQEYRTASGSRCSGALTHVSVLTEDILNIFMRHLHSIITWGKMSVASNFRWRNCKKRTIKIKCVSGHNVRIFSLSRCDKSTSNFWHTVWFWYTLYGTASFISDAYLLNIEKV